MRKAPGLARPITAPDVANAAREASVDTLAALVAVDAASSSKGIMGRGTSSSKSFVRGQVQIISKAGQRKNVFLSYKECDQYLEKAKPYWDIVFSICIPAWWIQCIACGV
ncbi:hypothetical protein C7212DRAFT_317666 [Tuber magnatum]|uniref:Uncharacterized protein n=1 Tax=Tuber magnatum TaxID=42249 RepID=A0A317SPH4_9PEZI|nr:hypothetical protein C7212DRAFT_317666 [Tuber magnatum]